MDRRERLIAVFAYTQDYLKRNRLLAEAVRRGREAVRLYAEDDYR